MACTVKVIKPFYAIKCIVEICTLYIRGGGGGGGCNECKDTEASGPLT